MGSRAHFTAGMWDPGLGRASELCCHHCDILKTFEQGALHVQSALGSTNDVAGLDREAMLFRWALCV